MGEFFFVPKTDWFAPKLVNKLNNASQLAIAVETRPNKHVLDDGSTHDVVNLPGIVAVIFAVVDYLNLSCLDCNACKSAFFRHSNDLMFPLIVVFSGLDLLGVLIPILRLRNELVFWLVFLRSVGSIVYVLNLVQAPVGGVNE